jgi:hypothetical protein
VAAQRIERPVGALRLAGALPISRAPSRGVRHARTYLQACEIRHVLGHGEDPEWVLEFVPASARSVDPLMGWTSSSDMNSQVRLRFDTLEAAKDYAADHGIDAVVVQPKTRKPNIRPRGYGENFATDRRGAWTH